MSSLAVDLLAGAVEFAWWVFWDLVPTLCFFTAFGLVFATTLGRVSVKYPEDLAKLHWTGLLWITRTPQGRTILSPALGVIVGFVVWVATASASIIFYSYR